jgi:hypothetical protein
LNGGFAWIHAGPDIKTEGSQQRKHHQIEGFLSTPNWGGLDMTLLTTRSSRSRGPQFANVNLSEFFIFFQGFLKDFPKPSVENRPQDASEEHDASDLPVNSIDRLRNGPQNLPRPNDETSKENIEYRDLKEHLLGSEAALHSSLLSAADRAKGKTLRPPGSFQTNVALDFANWRNFASRSSVKF